MYCFLSGSVVLKDHDWVSLPRNDVITEALPRVVPKTLILQSSKVPGLPQQRVTFLCKDLITSFHSSLCRPCFCLEITCSFHQKKKKCTQHETKEGNKISLMHCQATVPFPTTPCSFFKHKDVCHMVNESILKSVNRPYVVLGSLGAVIFPILHGGLWESVPVSLA